MKLKLGNLSEYVKNNKRFSLLFLLVIIVVGYVVMDICEDFSMRNLGSESNEAKVELDDQSDYEAVAESETKNINTGEPVVAGEDDDATENDVSGKPDEEEKKLITYEDILAVVEKEKLEKEAEEDTEDNEGEEADESDSYVEPKPEPKPVPKPEPEPASEPAPEPVVEVRNIELIVHVHFEDENGKSLPGESVEITVSQVGGDSLGSAFSDGQDARMSISAVDCIISGQEVSGFVSEGDKEVSISNDDDSVKHVSYKYTKVVQ